MKKKSILTPLTTVLTRLTLIHTGSALGVLCKVIMAMALSGIASTVLAGDGWFQTERLDLIGSLNKVLASNNVCIDKNDCARKQLIFVAGEPWGLDIYVYGIGDTRTVSQLVAACSDRFFMRIGEGKGMKYKIKITPMTKSEEMAVPFWKKMKYVEIIMEGENYDQR